MEDIRLEMVKTWKANWENSVSALNSVQEQGRKMLDLYLSQAENVQTEVKNVLSEGLKNARDAQMTYVGAIEDNLKKLEEMISPKNL